MKTAIDAKDPELSTQVTWEYRFLEESKGGLAEAKKDGWIVTSSRRTDAGLVEYVLKRPRR